jgi:hypothetical protein
MYPYNNVSQTSYAPAYQNVSLTQIPYTGVDFGAFGNAAYYASMIAFALSALVLVVYYVRATGIVGNLALKIDQVRGTHLV